MEKRVTETALILPSLYLMSRCQGTITTSTLIQRLREVMHPTGEDLELLSGRTDDKFSQKVRNLKAHNTLERFGYAQYRMDTKNGYFTLTPRGKEHLQHHESVVMYLLGHDFLYKDLIETLNQVELYGDARQIEVFSEYIEMEYHVKRLLDPSLCERSKELRAYALDFFTQKNQLHCHCCDLNYTPIYGGMHDFIELHHTKPVLRYKDEAMEKTLADALPSLLPLCANCHRMIHHAKRQYLEDSTLLPTPSILKRYV